MIKYFPLSKKNPKTKEFMFYPQIGHVEVLTVEDIARNISEVCTVTRHDILGVLSALQEEVIQAMLAGRSIRLGDLGSFRPTLSSSGSPQADQVNSSNIMKVRCRFTSGSFLRNGLRKRNLKFVRLPAAEVHQDSGSEHI